MNDEGVKTIKHLQPAVLMDLDRRKKHINDPLYASQAISFQSHVYNFSYSSFLHSDLSVCLNIILHASPGQYNQVKLSFISVYWILYLKFKLSVYSNDIVIFKTVDSLKSLANMNCFHKNLNRLSLWRKKKKL